MTDESGGHGPHLQVDFRIPLALVLTIIAQTVALVAVGSWYLSDLDGRVTVVESIADDNLNRVTIVEGRQYEADKGAARLDERLRS
jgi:hypothetical protein